MGERTDNTPEVQPTQIQQDPVGTDKDRIRLAEAMGWKLVEHCGTERWIAPGSLGFTGYLNEPNFDPFTDANDDYAVLEWMRSDVNAWEYQYSKELMLTNAEIGGYVIGDYARAALKVIDNE